MSHYTITRAQASTLHNSMWELRCVADELNELLNPKVIQRLNKGLDGVESIRKYLFDIIDKEDELVQKENEAFGADAHIARTIWSSSKKLSDNHSYPIGTPIECHGIVNEAFVSGPTYGDLWKDIDRLAYDNEDEFGCHIFIEGFRYDRERNILRVDFGS